MSLKEAAELRHRRLRLPHRSRMTSVARRSAWKWELKQLEIKAFQSWRMIEYGLHMHICLASGLSGVVRLAIQALLSHNMILHLRRRTAIVAKNPDHFVLVRLWNGRSCNFHVNFFPHLGHITNGLGAKRASILEVISHLLQAILMDGVSTWHYCNIVRWIE